MPLKLLQSPMKIEELRKELQEENLDTFLALENAHYLSETPASNVVIVNEDKSVLISSRMDFDRAKKNGEIEDVRAYAKTKLPLREGEEVLFGEFGKVIGEILDELGAKKIGFDQVGKETLEELKKSHEAEYRKKSDLIWNLRKIKSSKEIELLKKSAEIATKGMQKAAELIEAGRTEIEIAAEIEYEMRKRGSEGTAFDTILAGGRNSWLPHTKATDKTLEKEELVIVDLGAKWKGYRSDMTRTFAISPTTKQKEILEVARKAQENALNKVKDGAEAKKVDKAGRKVFKKSGYEEFCLHGSGHGVGLNIHEPPSLSPSSDDVLREGMVVTVEPGIYVREVGGGRFEDTVLVKENGYEKLTPTNF